MRVFVARDREAVLEELRLWSSALRRATPVVRRVGLFGSCATGAYGPGSDLDILVIVERSEEPRWFMRASGLDTSRLSIGADLFIYTLTEARRMEEGSAWFRHVLGETIWFD